MSFGERLNSSMKRCGYTNYRLAKSMDISESTVGYWVKDKVLPNAKQLIALSEKLSVSIDYLLKGEEYTMQEKNFQNSTISNSQIMVDSEGSPVNQIELSTKNELLDIIKEMSEEKKEIAKEYLRRMSKADPILPFIYENSLRFMNRFGDLFNNPYWVLFLELLDGAKPEERDKMIECCFDILKKNGHYVPVDVANCELFQHYTKN